MVPHTMVTPMSPLRGRGAAMRSPNISKAPREVRVPASHQDGCGTRGGGTSMSPSPSLPAPPQENTTCNVWGNTTDYRSTPTEEDLSRTPLLVRVPMG